MLIEKIKTPAMLEQTAEEATELAFACLKLARYLRDENPVYGRSEAELRNNIEEEFADIRVCYEELCANCLIDDTIIDTWIEYKKDRMLERIETDYKEICHGCAHELDSMKAEPCLGCFKGDRKKCKEAAEEFNKLVRGYEIKEEEDGED